jgi:hypothetical protein
VGLSAIEHVARHCLKRTRHLDLERPFFQGCDNLLLGMHPLCADRAASFDQVLNDSKIIEKVASKNRFVMRDSISQ